MNPHHPNPKWFALINDQPIPAPQQRLRVAVLREQARVPAGHALLRDHNSPEDVLLDDAAESDLAEGNVFYSRPRGEASPLGKSPAPPKLAFLVDDRPEITVLAEQSRESLLTLFNCDAGLRLLRDYESPHDQAIEPGAAVLFRDGPVFYTRGKHEHLVEIKIGKEFFKVKPGEYSVAELKKIGGAPQTDELEQVIDKKLVPLADDGKVCIKGGEVFIFHPRSGGSS